MDFAITPEQQDLKALVARIFDERVDAEQLPDYDVGQDWFDRDLWKALADSQLLGVALAEEAGGAGLGFEELCILLEEAGRTLAPLPLVPTLVTAALTIDRFGTAIHRGSLLPRLVEGDCILTAALAEEHSRDPRRPRHTVARREERGWRVDGVKAYVPAASLAESVMVPAQTHNGLAVLIVAMDSDGLELAAQETTTGEFEYRLKLTNVRVEDDAVLAQPGQGEAVVDWMIDHTTAALSVMALGVAERALRMTAGYTSDRKQFDKPIATFQAVAQRAADAYVDVEAMRLSAWQAVWRLGQGMPARREVAIAKYWAGHAGHRVTYAAQHLHGGIGVDTDYPLHRYFLAAHRIEQTLGNAHAQLADIGRMLAGKS